MLPCNSLRSNNVNYIQQPRHEISWWHQLIKTALTNKKLLCHLYHFEVYTTILATRNIHSYSQGICLYMCTIIIMYNCFCWCTHVQNYIFFGVYTYNTFLLQVSTFFLFGQLDDHSSSAAAHEKRWWRWRLVWWWRWRLILHSSLLPCICCFLH